MSPLDNLSPWNRGESYQPEEKEQGPPSWLGWALFLLLVGALFLGICLISSWMGRNVAHAHDAHNPALSKWSMQQKNQLNSPCCNGEDVFSLTDSEWRIVGDHYEAYFKGEWMKIPQSALIKRSDEAPTSNALLWVWYGRPQCFRPGLTY